MTPTELLAVAKSTGRPVREYPGWRDRCRCHDGSHERAERPSGRVWGLAVIGTLVHITAGNLGARTVEQYIADIIDGDPALPDKAQFVIAPEGTIWLNSAGRSNHAGTVSSAGLTAVQGGRMALTGWDDRRGNDADGNAVLYGIENVAASDMTPEQRISSVALTAAISAHYGTSGRDVAGHGELSDQRTYADPGLDMGSFRRDVISAVASITTPPGSIITSTGEIVTPQDIANIATAVTNELLKRRIDRGGKRTGSTSLSDFLAWNDSNLDGLPAVILAAPVPVLDKAGKPTAEATSLGNEAGWNRVNFASVAKHP